MSGPIIDKVLKTAASYYIPSFVFYEIFNCLSIMLLIDLLLNYDGNLTKQEIMWISGAILQTLAVSSIHIVWIYHSFHGVSYRIIVGVRAHFNNNAQTF